MTDKEKKLLSTLLLQRSTSLAQLVTHGAPDSILATQVIYTSAALLNLASSLDEKCLEQAVSTDGLRAFDMINHDRVMQMGQDLSKLFSSPFISIESWTNDALTATMKNINKLLNQTLNLNGLQDLQIAEPPVSDL